MRGKLFLKIDSSRKVNRCKFACVQYDVTACTSAAQCDVNHTNKRSKRAAFRGEQGKEQDSISNRTRHITCILRAYSYYIICFHFHSCYNYCVECTNGDMQDDFRGRNTFVSLEPWVVGSRISVLKKRDEIKHQPD